MVLDRRHEFGFVPHRAKELADFEIRQLVYHLASKGGKAQFAAKPTPPSSLVSSKRPSVSGKILGRRLRRQPTRNHREVDATSAGRLHMTRRVSD